MHNLKILVSLGPLTLFAAACQPVAKEPQPAAVASATTAPTTEPTATTIIPATDTPRPAATATPAVAVPPGSDNGMTAFAETLHLAIDQRDSAAPATTSRSGWHSPSRRPLCDTRSMMPARRTFTLWAFCDESGDLDNPQDAHAVIAVAATALPEELRRIVRETKQAARIPSGHPLHAYSDPPQVTASLLARLAELRDARLLVAALERRWTWRPVTYQELVTYTLRSFLDASSVPRAETLIVVEERYKGGRRAHFRAALADSLDLAPDQVRIERKNSPTWGAALQVADAVAWAHYQAIGRGRGDSAALVASLATVLSVGVDAQGLIRPVAELAGGPGGENKTAYP